MQQNTTEYSAPTRWITVRDWGKHHDWPPIGGLRFLIFNAERNGFSNVIRRVGRRILINEQAFFAWVDAQGKPASRGKRVA
jgi:hypothetical protein